MIVKLIKRKTQKRWILGFTQTRPFESVPVSAATTVILELVYLTGLVGYYTTADGETPRYSFICFSCLSICRVALARSFLVSAVVLIRQESERLLTRRRTARKMSKQKAADEKGGRLTVQRGASGYFFLSPATIAQQKRFSFSFWNSSAGHGPSPSEITSSMRPVRLFSKWRCHPKCLRCCEPATRESRMALPKNATYGTVFAFRSQSEQRFSHRRADTRSSIRKYIERWLWLGRPNTESNQNSIRPLSNKKLAYKLE